MAKQSRSGRWKQPGGFITPDRAGYHASNREESKNETVRESMKMNYMLLIVGGGKAPEPTEADFGPMMAQFEKITADLKAQGKLLHSARLRPNAEAKTVRLSRDGKRSVVDGPFTETKEAVGGYYMVDCKNEAEAIDWAKKFPPFFHIEVRALWEAP